MKQHNSKTQYLLPSVPNLSLLRRWCRLRRLWASLWSVRRRKRSRWAATVLLGSAFASRGGGGGRGGGGNFVKCYPLLDSFQSDGVHERARSPGVDISIKQRGKRGFRKKKEGERAGLKSTHVWSIRASLPLPSPLGAEADDAFASVTIAEMDRSTVCLT